MAPPVVSPPPIRFEYSSGIPVPLERCRMKNWHPGPGWEKLLYSVENFQIGWWKVQKFTCCPAEWISASVFPRWTRYSPRIRTRLGGLIRWEKKKKKKWKKRGRRGIFPCIPFSLTFHVASRKKKKKRECPMLGLFKYRIKEIYLILAFLFDHFFDPLYLRMFQLLIISIILIFKILTVWQFESRREKKKRNEVRTCVWE